jgi:hypothetical protein
VGVLKWCAQAMRMRSFTEGNTTVVTRKLAIFCQAMLLGTCGCIFAFASSPALAQDPPPDHKGAMSAPLFVEDLPVGSVSVRIARPSMTEPIVGADVVGSWTTKDGKAKSATVKTGADGRAIFAGVPVSSTFGAKATIEGKELATAQFAVPAQGGTRLLMIIGAQADEAMSEMAKGVHAGALGKTSDLSVLRISSDSRMMVELREDAIGIMQNLLVENTSDKVFDPGQRGLFIPLSDGFAGAEKLPGGAELEIKEGAGVFLHTLVPPTQAPAVQVRVGYVLATHETPEFDIVQPMPFGLQGGLILVPNEFSIELSAPGLRALPPARDDDGNVMRMYDLDAVAPGQALRMTVRGLPTRNQVGKWIAAGLVGLLIVAGILAMRRPRVAVPVEDHAG